MFKNIRYITSDPNKRTYEGLLKLKDFLNLGDNFQYSNCGFEDLEVEDDSIDFCFTSPPYFDTERYSNEPTQSYKKNPSYEDWRDSFLHVMLEKIMRCMKSGRYVLLNVGASKYPIDKDITSWLEKRNIKYCFKDQFRIGGCGIGNRASTSNSNGEPFIEFMKP
jgi:site-specific DNA-adenine methylase